ncbi:MAG: GAF domain-containing protein [Deltaproteobacteria bacterium]|nr:GAF domain-containing protein [Deltaproteobacteria bacterium]
MQGDSVQRFAQRSDREARALPEVPLLRAQREEDLFALIDDAPDIIARLDRDLRHVYVNRAIERATGLPRSAFLGKTSEELGVPEGLVALWREELLQVLDTGLATEISLEWPTPEGRRLYQIRVTPEIGADGRARSLLTISRDVTEARLVEENARRLIAEQAARAAAEVGERRYRFLADATALLDASLDHRQTLPRLARLVVPSLADFCMIDLLAHDGSIARVATAHVDPTRGELLAASAGGGASEGPPAVRRVLRSGDPLLLPELGPDEIQSLARTEGDLAVLGALGPTSTMVVPLMARSRAVGAMTLAATESRRRYGPEDLALAQDLARRAALAIDNARLYEAELEARKRSERAADRTARLQAVTAALSEAVTAAQVAVAVVEQARDALGAAGMMLVVLVDDGTALHYVHSVGYGDELGPPWTTIPVDAPLPFAEVARTGTLLCFSELGDLVQRYPALRELERDDLASLVCVPLLLESRPTGVLCASFRESRDLGEDQSFLLTLGRQCAEALERARLYEAERQARWCSELAAERTARLQSFTAALSEALTPAQVADVLLCQGTAAAEADAGALWVLDEAGTTATMVRALGNREQILEDRRRLPLTAREPIADAIRTGEPSWLPRGPDHASAATHSRERNALACLPLLVKGRAAGGLALRFDSERHFDGGERAFLLLLARQGAQALERARLYEAERGARRDAESAQDRLALLAEASRVLAEAALDFGAVIDTIIHLVTRSFGQPCLVALVGDDGQWIVPARDTNQGSSRPAFARELLAGPRDARGPGLRAAPGLADRVIETGHALVASGAKAEDHALLDRLGLGGLVVVPLKAAGRHIGILASGRGRGEEPFAEEDELLLQEIADRAALAIENARHYRQAEDALARMKDALEDREEAVAALSSERQRLEAVLQQMPAGVAIVEAPSGRLLLGNEQVQRILRLDSDPETRLRPTRRPTESGGAPDDDRFLGFHADGRPYEPHEWPVARSISSGEIVTGEEIEIVRGDGTRGALRVGSAPIRDASGHIVAGVVTIDDITDHKRAQEVLRASEAKLRRLVDSNIIGVVFGNGGDFITEGNDAFLELVGHSRADLASRRLHWAELTPPEYAELDERGREECRRTGSCTPYEKEYLRADGARVPILFGAAFLDESCRDWVGFVLDLTERKRAERHIEALYREAREAIQVRDEFLSIASHELKTPVTSLQLHLEGTLRRLKNGAECVDLGEKVVSKIEAANRQVHRLTKLIEELLDVSRISAGRLDLELERIDLGALVRDVVQRFEQDAQRGACSLCVDVPEAGRVIGHWDRLRLEQVTGNLLSNAIKYGRGQPVEVSLVADGAVARILVADKGIGIAADDQARIFGRFERLVSSRHFGGFGLGLWICRQIVEALGGSISVRSELGKGSTFEVSLPLPAVPS